MGKLVLVRHGQSQWNLENRFTGWVDVPITPLGEKEAHRAGKELKDVKFDVAYTSELQRAQQTLKIILEEIGQPSLPVTKDKSLNERHYGDLQGLDTLADETQGFRERATEWAKRSQLRDVFSKRGARPMIELTAARSRVVDERKRGIDDSLKRDFPIRQRLGD